MSSTTNSYGLYLAHLAASTINDTAVSAPFEGIDWQRLYDLAVFHSIAPLVYPSVQKVCNDTTVLGKFRNYNNMMIARDARQSAEAEKIFFELEQSKMPYIKLKGISIKHMYPCVYMRTLTDIDLCLTPADRTKAERIMQELGYTLEGGIDYHDEYIRDGYYICELHSSVVSPRADYYEIFTNPFDKCVRDGSDYGYVFCDEYYYLNLLTHLYKHFVSEGCGIRLFCDLYVFEKAHPGLEKTKILSILRRHELEEFYYTVCHLLECFFGDTGLTGKFIKIAEFIFTSGERGSDELKKLAWLSSDRTANLRFIDKSKYLLSNWFPPVSVAKARYPVLDKAPWLLPVCWVRRGFYTLFFRHASIKKQQEEIKRLNSKELKKAKEIRRLAGVK